ncbi:MAG: bifunctional homocysteine S-methyltransferase/methylenetetrahydrofolate reductase [Planctomycetota bacterium]
MRPSLIQHLQENLLVGDGAMGTLLYARGMPLSVSYDSLNLTDPERIRAIHREYVAAGARFIETNTFGADRLNLARHGLGDRVRDINLAGARIAREAAGDDAFVAGSVGPVNPRGREDLTESDLDDIYRERMLALAEGNVDALIYETFTRLDELLRVLALHRRTVDLPAVAQLALEEENRTADGVPSGEAFLRLAAAGAAVVGANCHTGPKGILHAFEEVVFPAGDLLLSAFPNAGLPEYVDGRYLYLATPDYLGQTAVRLRDAGVRLMGGCCGTTPDHVAAMAAALHSLRPVRPKFRPAAAHAPAFPAAPIAPARPTIPGLFREGRTIVIAELDPPRDLPFKEILDGAAALKSAGADFIALADNPLGTTRLNNVAMARLVEEKTGLRPIVHIACRDRNLVGQQSLLMGLWALGMDHVLAVTGDPAKFGDQPGSSSVYDLNSFDLITMLVRMNEGFTYSGRALAERARFVVGAAYNPNAARDADRKRLDKKVALGTRFVMTQPVFSEEGLERTLAAGRDLGVAVFAGVWPLVSLRNAEFLHNEVPGIQISEAVRRRMAAAGGREGELTEGMKIAREMSDRILARTNAIYFITPFRRFDLTAALVRHARAFARKSP